MRVWKGFFTCAMACSSVDDHQLCGLSLQVLTQTRPAAARTCSVASEPAVALESDPAKQHSPKMSRLLFIALYPGNTICCILCHLKMFLDETVTLLLLFPFPSVINGNNPLEKENIKG